ncbi:MAG: sensor histidine kinase [Bacteroidota bacterium]
MKRQLTPWQAAGFSFPLVVMIMIALQLAGRIRIDFGEVMENLIIFSCWWLVGSLLLYHLELLWKNRTFLLKVLGLLLISWLMMLADELAGIPDNPITIFLVVVGSIISFATIAPQFFAKYRSFLVGFYFLVFSYFLGARLLLDFSDAYFSHKAIFLPLFFLPIPFLVSLMLYDQWRWLQSLKSEKAEAELAMLKSQINPHFFFNTLHNLHSLTVTQSPQAPEVVLTLGKMMRYTIYEGKKDLVPVAEEVDYLKSYLELNRIRHRTSVDIDFLHHCQEGVLVAPLLFIILLENAFKHGVEKLMEGAYIKLDLAATADRIVFRVENNYDPAESATPPGIGLANLRRRLELTYPEQFTLSTIANQGVYRAELNLLLND